MFQLPPILFIVAITSAKLIKNDLPEKNVDTISLIESSSKTDGLNDTLWILDLNIDDLSFNKLFVANQHELLVFKKIIAPAIQNYKMQKLRRVKKDDPMKVVSEEEQQSFEEHENSTKYKNLKDIKKDIKKIMNKFLITHINDSESYLIENSKAQPQFKLYFIGPYTSLVLTAGKTRYQYFINPPSPLPSWFYDYYNLENGNKTYVQIPKNIQNEFLKKLLNLITNFLSFPI